MTDLVLIWTPGIIISFCGAVIVAISVGFALNQFYRNYKHMLYFAFMWGFWFIWMLFQGISDLVVSDLVLSTNLHFVCFYALVGIGYTTVLFVDAVSRTSLDPLKLILVTLASGAVILFSFDEDAIIIDTEGILSYPTMYGRFRFANLVLMGLIVAMLIYVNLKILFNTPKNLMKYSRFNIAGVFFYGAFPVIIQFTDLEHYLPGIANVSIALGVTIGTYALIKQPQIAFILPFKAYRILVVDTDVGMPIYSHEFSSSAEKFKEGVFSGFVKALGTLFDFTLDKGKVREIHLDEAVLILHSSDSKPLVSILIANKSSPSLMKAFQAFSTNLYHEKFQNYTYSPELGNFSFIVDYVTKYFSFIPMD
ncbi:MAG: hypothetical protein ACTSYI_17905 [Promethearchaeota archaeon]